MMRKVSLVLALAIASVIVGSVTALAASGYSLFGDASLVSPGFNSPTAAQIRYDPNGPGFGGVDFAIPAGLTVSGLNNLSSDFKLVAGDCGGGSPRFQINVTTPSNDTKNIFVYLGPPPNYMGCTPNWSNTGNLLTPTSLVDATQIGGTFYDPYGTVQTLYGSYPVTGIQIVADGFTSNVQTTHVDNVQINNATFAFEKPVPTNKDQCKNGGWMTFGRSDGSGFKNQGDCIQYVNTGK